MQQQQRQAQLQQQQMQQPPAYGMQQQMMPGEEIDLLFKEKWYDNLIKEAIKPMILECESDDFWWHLNAFYLIHLEFFPLQTCRCSRAAVACRACSPHRSCSSSRRRWCSSNSRCSSSRTRWPWPSSRLEFRFGCSIFLAHIRNCWHLWA